MINDSIDDAINDDHHDVKTLLSETLLPNRGRGLEKTFSRGKPIVGGKEDLIWKQGQTTPYLAFSKTLQAIEATSGRLKTIEILSNYFRSVMVLSPDDLLPSVYMCLNKLAPAYEGMELGIGETVLMKAIAQTTGMYIFLMYFFAIYCKSK